MVNNNLKFILDEFDDSVLVEIQKFERNGLIKTYKRMDYFQFFNYINKISEKEEERLEAIRKFKEEEMKRNKNSVGRQLHAISEILYSPDNLNLNKPLLNVVAIEDCREDDSTTSSYKIYFEINSINTYNFKEIIFENEFHEVGSFKIPKTNRVNFDYGSKYVVCVPVIENTKTIVPEELKVTRKCKYSDGTESVENIPFLERIYSQKLSDKTIEILSDRNSFKNIFNTLSNNELENNPTLRQRINEIKYTTNNMDWKGLV